MSNSAPAMLVWLVSAGGQWRCCFSAASCLNHPHSNVSSFRRTALTTLAAPFPDLTQGWARSALTTGQLLSSSPLGPSHLSSRLLPWGRGNVNSLCASDILWFKGSPDHPFTGWLKGKEASISPSCVVAHDECHDRRTSPNPLVRTCCGSPDLLKFRTIARTARCSFLVLSVVLTTD